MRAKFLAAILLGAFAWVPRAEADHVSGHGADTAAEGSAITIYAQDNVNEQVAEQSHDPLDAPTSDSSDNVVGDWILQPVCAAVNGGGCVTTQLCEDLTPASTWYFVVDGVQTGGYSQCPGDPAPSAATPAQPLTVTPGQVLQAFRRVELPASVVVIPPGGETLVNFPTNVYTESESFTETIEFFGGRMTVVLRIEPSSYAWHRGDGTVQRTEWPGRAWRKSDGREQRGLITHIYLETTKDAPVSVDTTWSATWTLNGRDMGAVPGTVTIEGDSEPLDVLEARPVLVG